MAKFNIQITKELQGVFEIEAENLDAALLVANRQYRDGDITLDDSNANVDYRLESM